MTLLKTLAINLVMLAVTVGVAYWALDHEEPRPLLPASVTHTTPDPSLKPQTPAVPSAPTASPEVASVLAPTLSPSPHAGAPKSARRRVTFPINLNTAKVEEFMELPGIGEKLAERIVAYRRAHGKFKTVGDLRDVKGIGKKRLDRLRPLITTTAHD